MAYIAPGTIISPATVNVETQYESDVDVSAPISVFRFFGTTGKFYNIGVETSSTNWIDFTLTDSVLYLYKPSTVTFTSASRDYVNDDDFAEAEFLLPPYPYQLYWGSRALFTADETGWFVIIITAYGTSF